jgi:DNA-binding CsgD family transcriptional regulator
MRLNSDLKRNKKSSSNGSEEFNQLDKTAKEVFDYIPFGIILCNPQAEVLSANCAAREILDRSDGLRLVRKRLSGVTDDATLRLRQAIACKTTAEEERMQPIALRLNRNSGERQYALLVSKLHTGSENGDATVALFVCDTAKETNTCEPLLQLLFDFTPAEARLARELLRGNSIEDSSGEIGISPNTARNQLKSMFSKTNSSRQGELIRIMMQSPAVFRQV